MDGLSIVILGEGLDLSAMAGGTLAGQEAQIAVAGRLELTMRLRRDKTWYESLNGWMEQKSVTRGDGWTTYHSESRIVREGFLYGCSHHKIQKSTSPISM